VRYRGLLLASALAALLACAGCRPGALSQAEPLALTGALQASPLHYRGRGAASLSIGPWTGAAALHVTAVGGAQPFSLVAQHGLERAPLVEQLPPVDEFRVWSFGPAGLLAVEVQGDAQWEITLLPITEQYFPVVQVPGKYRGKGAAVVLLQGEHSIAIFDAPDLVSLSAWAYSPEGEGEQLAFKTSGEYPGRAVLPQAAAWLVVSCPGSWSVEVQPPCCTVQH